MRACVSWARSAATSALDWSTIEDLIPRSSETSSGVLRLVLPPYEPTAEELFEREEAAFMSQLPSLYLSHHGRFVAIHNGDIAASGATESDVARSFFEQYGDTHVFIGFVGQESPAYQIHPRR